MSSLYMQIGSISVVNNYAWSASPNMTWASSCDVCCDKVLLLQPDHTNEV